MNAIAITYYQANSCDAMLVPCVVYLYQANSCDAMMVPCLVFSKSERGATTHNGPRVCAFHPYMELDDDDDDDDIPFRSLLQPACPHGNGYRRAPSPDGGSSQDDEVDHRMSSATTSRSSSTDNRSSHSANSSAHDDFVMVELVRIVTIYHQG